MSASTDGDRDGATYDHGADYARLNGQARRVFDALADHEWHTLRDLADLSGDPETSVSARLRDFRKARYGAWVIERELISRGLFRYRLTGEQIEAAQPLPAVPESETLTVPVHRDRGGKFSPKSGEPAGLLSLFD